MSTDSQQPITIQWPDGWNVNATADIELEVNDDYELTISLNGEHIAVVDRRGTAHFVHQPDHADGT